MELTYIDLGKIMIMISTVIISSFVINNIEKKV